MVQSIENWTDLRGRIESVAPDPVRDGFVRVTMKVEEARDVAGFPSLLAAVAGRTTDVSIRLGDVDPARLRSGAAIHVRARSTANGVFAHPDHIEVE